MISEQTTSNCRAVPKMEQSFDDNFLAMSSAGNKCHNSALTSASRCLNTCSTHMFEEITYYPQGESSPMETYDTGNSQSRQDISSPSSLSHRRTDPTCYYSNIYDFSRSHSVQQHQQRQPITEHSYPYFNPEPDYFRYTGNFVNNLTNQCSDRSRSINSDSTNKINTTIDNFNPGNKIHSELPESFSMTGDINSNCSAFQDSCYNSNLFESNVKCEASPPYTDNEQRLDQTLLDIAYNIWSGNDCIGDNCFNRSNSTSSTSSSGIDDDTLYSRHQNNAYHSESEQLYFSHEGNINNGFICDQSYLYQDGISPPDEDCVFGPSDNFYGNNAAESVYYLPSGGFNETTYTHGQYTDMQHADSGHGSDESLDPETNVPHFSIIQQIDSDRESQSSRSISSGPKQKNKAVKKLLPSVDKERRKPGRKPGQVSNVLHLWEFMRDLLHSKNGQGVIEWISKQDGVFQVKNSSEVARLWGEKKKNKKKMTYEKLSRSLRYSRLEGYFADLPKDKNYPKKLCFMFGPKSKNWCDRKDNVIDPIMSHISPLVDNMSHYS